MTPAKDYLTPEGSKTILPSSVSSRGAWWVLVCLLPAVVIMLFIPWSSASEVPPADVRPELVWSSVATVILGALALAFPHRWMSYVAFIPTIGALTAIGPVLMPESGSYPWPVKVVVLSLAVIGIAWVVSAFSFPAREQQTRWIIAPVAAALTFATIWLPWVVVSGIGEESGQMAAFQLFFATSATGAPGVTLFRLMILIIMAVGVGIAVLPLATRRASATRLAMTLTIGAAFALVMLCLVMSLRGDAVRPADTPIGLRVALAGFTLIALVWNSRLKAVENLTPDGAPYPRRVDDSGYIPVIMTGRGEQGEQPPRPHATPQFIAPEPSNGSSSSGDSWRQTG
ncbi:hypothetical protein [Blastococcus sp. Marseille-P5729]|uniref:hypothetical protein n=1 Tax=Blastococcus sp. Marseille-P5729 TaxID=2086582 RepID=UPI00131C90DC|nr:hypothetical protein [Blastococcus sp. Marseille-P5729]